jgi:cell division septum initiation protein DivIVA
MSEPANPTPAAEPGENSTIKHLRETAEAANRAAKEAADRAAAAEAKLTEIERAKLEENERLKLELADARKIEMEAATLRDELGRYQSTLQAQYEAELAAVPEEKRALVAQLSGSGSWPDRVKALQAAKSLAGTAPAAAGTITQPGTGTPPAPGAPPPTKLDPKNPPRLTDVFNRSAGGG